MMSEARRHEVLRIAAAWRVAVIDDTVMAEPLPAGSAPPDLASIDSDSVLGVGSLSKSIWAACASAACARRLRRCCA